MSSASISDIKSYFMGNVNSGNKSKEAASDESFSQVFDKTQDTGSSEGAVKTSKTEDSESISNHANVQKKEKPEIPEKTQKSPGDVDEAQLEAAMEEAASQMVEQTAKVLNVTVEDVEAVLDTLGLTPLDLFGTEGLTQVIQALNPEADALSIMTNEQLFTDLKGLMNFADGLMEQTKQQFGLSEEDMTGFMENMKEQLVQTPVSDLQPQLQQEVPEDIGEPKLTEAAADNLPKAAEIPVEVEADITRVPEQPEADTNADTEPDSALETKAEVKPETAESLPEQTVSQKGEENRSDNGSHTGNQNSFGQNILNQLSDAVNQTGTVSTTYGASGTEIIHQITEYIKVHVNVDTTEMELQLHPASLGNVKVQIASTEGILTATFTTENETVKAALEAQLVQLKDNFAEQGLKVESIEVNVAAQGFERSLDEQEQQQREAFEAEARRRRGRRIRLSGAGELEGISQEEMSEEDKVVADMMIRSGNTVDYTV